MMLPQVMRLGDSGTTEAESREVPVPALLSPALRESKILDLGQREE